MLQDMAYGRLENEFVHRAAAAAKQVEGVTEILYDVPFGGGENVTTMMTAVQAHGGEATELVLCADHTAPIIMEALRSMKGAFPWGRSFWQALPCPDLFLVRSAFGGIPQRRILATPRERKRTVSERINVMKLRRDIWKWLFVWSG